MAVLGLCFCARAFSSCGKRGPLFIVVHGPLTIAASLVAEHRLQTRRLSNCGSAACGIFPDQGSNPFPLHWQADSQPLRHQGSPHVILLWHWSCSFHPFRSFASAVCACTRVHTRTHTHTLFCLTDFLLDSGYASLLRSLPWSPSTRKSHPLSTALLWIWFLFDNCLFSSQFSTRLRAPWRQRCSLLCIPYLLLSCIIFLLNTYNQLTLYVCCLSSH